MTEVFDDRRCTLGEGPIWHPERAQLFWFDITGHRLLSRGPAGPEAWDLGECVSAAGWIDRERLLIASETGLWQFDIETGQRELLTELEADRPETRSNDGRADPFGGFWIGTMGKSAEPRAGAIYRYFGGRIETLFTGITIPNAICFAPGGHRAYFADTAQQKMWSVHLDGSGWPVGDPELFLNQRGEGLNPDGAATDADGAIWVAQWGAGRVSRFFPNGELDRTVTVPARHSTCPCFGGPDLDRIYVTSAIEGLDDPTPSDGRTFILSPGVSGLPAPRVTL